MVNRDIRPQKSALGGPFGKNLFSILVFWLLLFCPPAAGEDGAQSRVGEVIVNNRTSIPLTIHDSADTRLAHVDPGSSVSLTLPAGRHSLKARRDAGSLYLSGQVHIVEGGRIIWNILPIEAVLSITNQSPQKVHIEMDGLPLTELKAEASIRLEGISPGPHTLTARAGETLVAQTVADIPPRGLYHWNLEETTQKATQIPVLQVRNFAGRPVDLFVNQHYRVSLDPGEMTAMIGIPPGEVALEARVGAEIIDTRNITLPPGEIYQWDVAGPEGARAMLEVVNHYPEEVKVCVDGALCLKIKGLETIQYDALVPGRHLFQAYRFSTGLLLDAIEADLAPARSYQWVIENDNISQTPTSPQENTDN